ncbi:MAG: hypothetical protein HYV78_01980 [Candidatus Wildermuthbacteria bacterium]|nr:hypothetical protein [Candidatus Wildermuthbacteria bacterium]
MKLGTDFTSNASNQNFTTSAVININSTGNWSRGYYNGQISAIDSSNAAITQTVWFYFDIKGVLHTYGWPVSPGTDNYYNYNTSSNNITMLVTAYRYNVSRTDYWPFTATADINVTVTGIEKQSCASWPCTYSNVTGWTAPVATSKSDGTAHVNITRSNGWASGWHYMNVTLKDSSTGELVTFNRWMGFWVNS